MRWRIRCLAIECAQAERAREHGERGCAHGRCSEIPRAHRTAGPRLRGGPGPGNRASGRRIFHFLRPADLRPRNRFLAHDGYLSHPVVAEAGHGADDALLVAGIADRAPRTRQGLAEQRVAGVDAPPHRADQLVAPDRPLAMLEQVNEAFERFQRQGDRVVAAAKLARERIEFKALEPVAP